MNNNSLENFIKSNRKAFDTFAPSDALWQKIEQDLNKNKPKKKPLQLYVWLSSAAAIIVVLGVGLFFAKHLKQTNESFANENIAYSKKVNHFAGLIEEKKDSLAIFAATNPDLYKKFTTDLDKLDEEYFRLKRELNSSPNPVFIVNAMLKNREVQLQLLKQQLLIINQVDDVRRVNQI